LSLVHEINKQYKQHSLYGKDVYFDVKSEESVKIHKIQIENDLKIKLEQLTSELEEWKKNLLKMRTKYYFLTFVPNSIISELLDCVDKNDQELVIKLLRKFKYLRLINPSITEAEYLNIPSTMILQHLDKLTS